MISDETHRRLFCGEPKDEQTKMTGEKKWSNLMEKQKRGSNIRCIQEPQRATQQDLFRFRDSHATNVAKEIRFDQLDDERKREALTKVQEAVGVLAAYVIKVETKTLAEASLILLTNGERKLPPKPVFTQSFEGLVRSVDDEQIIVEFKVGDDLEERQFARKEMKLAGKIEEGDTVWARCQLDLVGPTPPMSSGEIEKWKQEHRDMEEYHKKTKRGKSLLEDETE